MTMAGADDYLHADTTDKDPQYYADGGVKIYIDFNAITKLFVTACEEGRNFLFEYETYQLLHKSGAETPPRVNMLVKGSRPSDEELLAMPGDKVVLKIVSPTIIHKTEVGGVKIIPKSPEKIRSTWRRMMYEVPENYAAWIERYPEASPPTYKGLSGETLINAISRDIRGVLQVQFMPPDSAAFGNELIVGVRKTREFGMVISAGLGGTDTELYAQRFRKGQAIVAASTEMVDGLTFFEMFRKTISYKKLAGLTRGQRRIVTDEQLIECFSSFIAMANYYSPCNPDAPFVIDELEINPFAFTDFLMTPLDGMCRFSKMSQMTAPRPISKIGSLLHPESIGVMGVSSSRMNFGRTILKNILENGFDKNKIVVIHPGENEIDGVVCIPGLASLNDKLDLLVVAVDASNVPDLVSQVIDLDAANSVMLIPGGLGEKKGSEDRAVKIKEKINNAHMNADGGPIFLGGNCLGVVSHPGKYDTLFIPEEKLPKQRGDYKRKGAFISQSGAFMITRVSKRSYLDPAYMVSIGNQTDLTLGDMVAYLKDLKDLDVIAVYAEGFNDLDGLSFAKSVREAVLSGKDVIFYKAGRTPEGKNATSGHTASLAGDYMVCESCIRQAGAMVAQTFTEFEDLFFLSQRLHSKRIHGNRLAAVSGAGFEAVGMADSIQSDDYKLKMSIFDQATITRLENILEEKKLASLVDVKNPLDINPGADDEAHSVIVEAIVQDANVDAVVVGLDPLSPAMHTLSNTDMDHFSMHSNNSITKLMPPILEKLDKPVIGVVDGGGMYDPLVDELQKGGLPVFRSSDRAVAAIAKYIEGRLHAENIRSRLGIK